VDQGLLTEALLALGCACNVTQIRCFREGANSCVYEVTSAFVDKRWAR
jgi:predicted hydrocarbon binding protein